MLRKKDLHEYQEEGVDHIINKKHSALFLEMGLGKTVTTLTAIEFLIYQELDIENALVIAPKRVAESVWDAEINKWEHLRKLKISKVIGSVKQRKEALMRKADIYIIGRDNVPWLCGQYGGSMLPFSMLVLDELSSFKNPKSVRFKALKKVQPSFRRVVGLTGTPAPNGLIDLWSQIYLLDRGERLGKFVSNYRSEFFSAGARQGHVVFKYHLNRGAEKEIHGRISDICLSMKAKDYLKMPDKIMNEIFIDFPVSLQEKYEEFEKEAVLEIFEEELEDIENMSDIGPHISAVNAAALSNKLLQFANGAVYDNDKNWHEVHNLKIEAVKEIVEDNDGPILIAWTYRHDLYRLEKALKKYNPRQLKDNQDILDWNEGKIKVMMMHPASGGHGLNLQAGGNHVVWFGQTWSLELYEQFNARLYRQGQTKPVFIHKLISRKTMDQNVVKAQMSKYKKQEALMEAVKVRIQKYFS